MLDDITLESFSTTVDAIKVCASKRLPFQTPSTESPLPRSSFTNFFKSSCEGSYLRNAYKVRIIPARQNPSKNLSVLNIVTFTDSATVNPKIRMKVMEQSSTGRRPTLHTEKEKVRSHH